MNIDKEIPIIYASVKICDVIRSYLQSSKLDGLCDIKNSNNNGLIIRYADQEKEYNAPIRMGELLDQLIYYNKSSDAACINFDGGSLDINRGIFTNKLSKQISLTEKETAILSFLYKNKGNIVPRAELLRAVWGYADNVQTHTLETHIYRLRQKIEQDPANPQILMTRNDGYCVPFLHS